jgi:hypothetical protein
MTIVQRGTDSSGRPIRSSPACWAAFDAACAELGFVPVIVQGGYQGSGGAAASADTHAGDAFDLRLRDRTATERARMIRVFRAHAFAYWERYPAQGFDLHAHMVPGPWASPAPQALGQWNDYLNGRNGLKGHAADYHPRPTPLVTTPPKKPQKETERMNATQEQKLNDLITNVSKLASDVKEIKTGVKLFRAAERASDLQVFRKLASEGKSNDEILEALDRLERGAK